jgi:hypothetical protein
VMEDDERVFLLLLAATLLLFISFSVMEEI